MKLLEDKILTEGKILPGDILKVDGFLNHQMDVDFLDKLACEIYEQFKNRGINKILTIEASGIGLACLTARFFHCKVLAAKKNRTLNISDDVYSSSAFSYTHKKENAVLVSKEYICDKDVVLIVDDFLASGNACLALYDIARQSGASVAGVACAVEKTYQGGRALLEQKGIKVVSLAKIGEMSDGKITFSD